MTFYKEISETVKKELNTLLSDLTTQTAVTFCNTWVKSKPDNICRLYKSGDMLSQYNIKLHYAKRVSKHFINLNCGNFNLDEYITSLAKTDKKYHYTSTNHIIKIKEFSEESYLHICKVAVAILLNRYDASTICKEHIIYTLILMLLKYYNIYDKDIPEKYAIQNISDVITKTVAYFMHNLNLEELNEFAKSYNFYYNEVKNLNAKRWPSCREDLSDILTDDMTQKQKMEAVMMNWCCKERKARSILSQFGFTDNKFTRNDYKEEHDANDMIHEHLYDIEERIDENTEEIEEDIKSHIDNVSVDILDNQKNIIDKLNNILDNQQMNPVMIKNMEKFNSLSESEKKEFYEEQKKRIEEYDRYYDERKLKVQSGLVN